jgi:hypothetical protein
MKMKAGMFQVVSLVLVLTIAFIWPIPSAAHTGPARGPVDPPAPSPHACVYRTTNGFSVAATENTILFQNPLGETMAAKLLFHERESPGFTAVLDDAIAVDYVFEPCGREDAVVKEITVSFAGQTVTAPGVSLTNQTPEARAAFNLLTNALTRLHSREFYEGVFNAGQDIMRCPDRYLVSGSGEKGKISCILAVAGYGLSIGGLVAACVGTVGAGCILALLAHEVGAASVLASCSGVNW